MNINRVIKTKNRNFFLLIFFVLLSIFSIFRLIDNAMQLDSWQYGEWLINYQSGFVRRGLIGEFLYLLSKIFNSNLQVTFILFLSAIVFFYYYLNYQFIKNIKLNFINLLIIFSPIFYFFLVIISKVGIKKEIILYIFYLIFLYQLKSENFNIKRNWMFIFIFPFLLLNHEGQFFFLPYLVLPLLFVVKKHEIKEFKIQSLSLFFISILTTLLLYNFRGTVDHTLNICESLNIYAPAKCDWWGPIFALSLNLGEDWGGTFNLQWLFSYIHNDYKSYFGFIFYIVYSFLPFYIFIKFARFKKKFLISKKKIIFTLLILFLFSLPLFHLAQDWSRWFSIHFHLLAFLIFFLQQKKIINLEKVKIFPQFNNFFLNKNVKIYLFIFLFFYATSVHHHHFFLKGVRLEFTYYKVAKKLINNY